MRAIFLAMIAALIVSSCATAGGGPSPRKCWLFNKDGRPARSIGCNELRELQKMRAGSRVETF